jgi:hypothetical protein
MKPGKAADEKKIAIQLKKLEVELVKKKNFVGYGIGLKNRKGNFSNELCAVFFVQEKVKSKQLSEKDILPRYVSVAGKKIATDVVEMEEVILLGNPAPNLADYRPNPVPMGVGIRVCPAPGYPPAPKRPQPPQPPIRPSNRTLSKGTAGALVEDRGAPSGVLATQYILTAGHVLNKPNPAGPIGNDVVYPINGKNRDKNGKRNENIGGVARIAGAFTGNNYGTAGIVDAGLVEVIQSTSNIISIGKPLPPVPPVINLKVQKSGMKTGLTQSSIAFTNVTMVNRMFGLNYSAMNGLFFVRNPRPKQDPFGSAGDSGSLIVTEKRAALGLLVGALPKMELIIGQEIGLALTALSVDLVTR